MPLYAAELGLGLGIITYLLGPSNLQAMTPKQGRDEKIFKTSLSFKRIQKSLHHASSTSTFTVRSIFLDKVLFM